MVGESYETDVRVNIWYLLLKPFFFFWVGETHIKAKKSRFLFIYLQVSPVCCTGGLDNLKSLGFDGCRVYVKYSVQ